MKEILIIGHKNPDTDAICSAIGYAEFKQRTGMPNAVAARCGGTNERIDFVLKYFGVPAPKFVSDVSPRISDVMQTHVISITPETTAIEALGTMDRGNIRVMPVLDGNQRCIGLVSVFKMSKYFILPSNPKFDSRRVLASIAGLKRILKAKLLCGKESTEEEDMIIMIGAMSLDSFQQRLIQYPRERLVVIVGDRREIQELAIREKVRVVVVTGGFEPDGDLIEEARQNEVAVLSSPHDSASTAMLSRASISVRHMIHQNYLAFAPDENLSFAKNLAADSMFQAFPVIDEHKHVVGILSKSDFLKKVNRQLILVDHNELSQAVQGAGNVEILEVIDHHRIGSLTTSQPILFRNEPVGSTSTIVADCFFRYHVNIPKHIAGLLLGGLVSDTLNLTSPTTTAKDADILSRLEQIAGVNAREFTEKFFATGSLLTLRSPGDAIKTDCKEYEESGYKFSVAQIEEAGFDQFWRSAELVKDALELYRDSGRYYFSALLVTDITRQNSVLLIAGPKDFKDTIHYPELRPGIFELNGVVSRKKQVLPFLTQCIEHALTGRRTNEQDSV